MPIFFIKEIILKSINNGVIKECNIHFYTEFVQIRELKKMMILKKNSLNQKKNKLKRELLLHFQSSYILCMIQSI